MSDNEDNKTKERQILIPVLGGSLCVTICNDPNYPGVDVEYVADDEGDGNLSRPRVTMEMDIGDDSDSYGELRAYMWEDPKCEDYTRKTIFGNYKDK